MKPRKSPPLSLLSFALCVTAVLAGCMNIPVESFPATEPDSAAQPKGPPAWGGPPEGGGTLYGFDGTPVRQPGVGSVTTEPVLGHDMQKKGDGSRLYLLELYQRAMDEKDELSLEVSSLGAALEESEKSYAALEGRFGELERRAEALEAEKATLQDQNFDLAARLTTAQIRRLEAEKLLLEATVEWNRLKALTSGAPEKGQ